MISLLDEYRYEQRRNGYVMLDLINEYSIYCPIADHDDLLAQWNHTKEVIEGTTEDGNEFSIKKSEVAGVIKVCARHALLVEESERQRELSGA